MPDTSSEDFAVVIGISHYPAFTTLPGLENFAPAFAAWLTDPSGGALSPENLSLVVSEVAASPDPATARPKSEDIEGAFMPLVKRLQQGGRVGRRLYIYMSGLGLRSTVDSEDVALLLPNASYEFFDSTAGARMYANYFRNAGAFEEIVLFVDCAQVKEPLGPLPFKVLPFVPGRSPDSFAPTSFLYGFALANESERHGLFTTALLEALHLGPAGQDGEISSVTLASFVKARVSDVEFHSDLTHPIVFRQAVPATPAGQPEEKSPVPSSVAYPTPRIASDRWAERDALGYEPFARTVAMLISHEDTLPPLTIGIKAPWGAGKTSLMKRVQYLLDGDAHVTEENEAAHRNRSVQVSLTLRQLLEGLRELTQTAPKAGTAIAEGQGQATAVSGQATTDVATAREEQQKERRVESADLLQKAAQAIADVGAKAKKAIQFVPPQPKASADGKACGIPPRVTVWFNAWKYQTSEQIWAGLAHCIISQVTARMSAVDRELFWMKLHASRIDVNQLRWQVWLAIVGELIPWLLGSGVLLLCGLFLTLSEREPWYGLSGAGLSLALTAGSLWYKRSKKLGEKVSGKFKELVREPDYEGKLGFLHLVETDIREVLDLVATPREPLVIFVDDLDRCAPHKVAEIVEAINLFLSGDYPNCIFVLGMEPAMVAAALEVANKDLLEKAQSFGPLDSHVPLGWRFMEKIIQLPLALPPPDSEGSKSYLAYLTGAGRGRPALESPAAPPTRSVEDYIADLGKAPSIEAVVQQTERLIAEAQPEERPFIAEASKQAYARKFTDRDPAISRFIEETMTLFRGNPRQLKRYVNLFRFTSTLRHNIRMDRVATCAAEPKMPSDDVLTKFIALSIHWPQATDYLRLVRQVEETGKDGKRQTTLMARLEEGVRDLAEVEPEKADEHWKKSLEALGLDKVEWLSSREFRQFLGRGEALAGYEDSGLW